MIKANMSNEEYHQHPAYSKTFLWSVYTKTPHHAKNMRIEKTAAMDLGTATHVAILEPEKFLTSVIKGPDDRRGNKWKDVYDEAAAYGKLALTSGDYEKCLYMRDSAHRLSIVRQLTDGLQKTEQSAFWQDEATGLNCRCRPDLYHPGLAIMADLKTTADASKEAFRKSVAGYGYHMQQAFYSDGWTLSGGGAVEGFVFIAVESFEPFAVAVYELKPSAYMEGKAATRSALETIERCEKMGIWDGYSEDVQELDLPHWAYKETFESQFATQQGE